MRLTQAEQIMIVQIVRKHFGENVKIWLYGPRLDPSANLSDLNLYIESSLSIVNHKRARFAIAQELTMAFQSKVDISTRSLLDDPRPEEWLQSLAKKHGKRLY